MSKYQHQRVSWYNEYNELVTNVESVKRKLELPENDLTSDEIYKESIFKNYHEFLSRIFANKGNGVASNGRSILSTENLEKVRDDVDFLKSLEKLIIETTSDNLNEFSDVWKEKVGQNNPVLTNRVAAACNTNLSTTVNEPDFHETFNWLKDNNYLDDSVSGENWFERNESLVNYLRGNINQQDFNSDDTSQIKVDVLWLNIFVWLVYENIANPFKLKKQVVKYGAPGTGKTYKAKEMAELQFDIWKNSVGKEFDLTFNDCFETVQFHPSYSYEDFIEGLRPVPDKDGQSQLKLQNGIFKELCKKAGEWEIDLFALNNDELKSPSLNELTVKDIEKYQDELKGNHWQYIFSQEDKSQTLESIIPPHFILIDEINRAELSRVFGELMYSLEYRGTNGRIKTQYAQLNSKCTGMLKVSKSYQFFVPHNVYIIATMNTIDRSVDSFDFALRRRFRWEEVQPDTNLLRYHLQDYNKKWIQLADDLYSLNYKIENNPLLGKDYCIGHAYLWNLSYNKETTINNVRKLIWRDSLESLLYEYLRGTGSELQLLSEFKNEFGIK